MIQLFHSYQYILNSKDIIYDTNKKIIKSKNGSFMLGLLQIPNIPNHIITTEKFLVSKRQSKKMLYRNHTKNNIKLYIAFTENDFINFINNHSLNKNNNSQTQLTYFFNLVKKTYFKYTKEQNLFDIISLKSNIDDKPFNKNTLSFKLNNLIKIGKFTIDLTNKTIFSEKSNCIIKQYTVDGGIIYLNNKESNKQLDILLNKLFRVNNKLNFLIAFDNDIIFNFWKKRICKFNNNYDLNYLDYNNLKIINIIQNPDCEKYGLIRFSNNLDYISFDKLNYKNICIEKNWLIINDYSLLSISNLHKILENIFSINIDIDILTNIDNIYQLSKIITISNTNKELFPSFKYKRNSNTLSIDQNFYNIISTCKTKLIDNCALQSESCSICMKNAEEKNTTFIKTSCEHFYCLECFESLINFTNKDNENLRCGYCRRSLKNNIIFLLNYENTFNKYKKLLAAIKNIDKNKVIIFKEYNCDDNLLFFITELFIKFNSNQKKITIEQISNINNFSLNDQVLIIDSNNTNKKTTNNILKLGIPNTYIVNSK